MNTKITTETLTLLEQNLDGIDQTKPLLNLRDREIALLCHLKTNPTEYEIGNKMCIRPKSVENYKTRIGDKLCLKGRHALFRFVLKNRKFFKKLATIFIPSAQGAEKQETGNRKPRKIKKSKIEGITLHGLRGYPYINSHFEPLPLWCFNKIETLLINITNSNLCKNKLTI